MSLSGSDYIAQLNSDSLALYDVDQNKVMTATNSATKYGLMLQFPIYTNVYFSNYNGYGKGGALFKIDNQEI